jgi:hypothetical protein
MAKRKRILNAALKSLLAGLQTSAVVKIPATFISELASLPDDKQKVLAELSQEQFNQLLIQSELATINAAESAAGAKQIKALIEKLIEKVDGLLPHPKPAPQGPTQNHNLQIHINPTRDRQRQLAQIRILNTGPLAILLDAWFVMWTDKSGLESVCCERGVLPIRLQDHERADLLVDISGHPAEQLESLGVVDAERQWWPADEKELKQFIHVAKLYQLPKIDPPTNKSTEPSNVSIMVATTNSSVDRSKLLEVRFKNLGPNVLQPRYAHVEWSYEPFREMPNEPGEPKVMESGGSISLKRDDPHQILSPNDTTVFYLSSRDPFAQVIVAVLADDVPDEQLRVKVSASRWLWTASSEEVPNAIREFARAVLHEMR